MSETARVESDTSWRLHVKLCEVTGHPLGSREAISSLRYSELCKRIGVKQPRYAHMLFDYRVTGMTSYAEIAHSAGLTMVTPERGEAYFFAPGEPLLVLDAEPPRCVAGDLLASNPGWTVEEVAHHLGVSAQQVRDELTQAMSGL